MKLKDLMMDLKRKPAFDEYEGTTPESDTREVYSAMEGGSSEEQDYSAAKDAEQEQELFIQDLISSGMTKEEAETLAEKQFGFKPGAPLEAQEVPDVMPAPQVAQSQAPVMSEDIGKRYSEIFDIISRGYGRLQKEGRVGK